jgi:SagB-type dehydrogenase family enzyme
MTWREYHGSTKHSVESLRRTPHVLDWRTCPIRSVTTKACRCSICRQIHRSLKRQRSKCLTVSPAQQSAGDGSTFLSQLLFNSAAISASKRVPSTGYRYALRVDPSSGNLHPTEFHFLARGLKEWPDGLYHYRPSAHMAEQRARGDLEMKLAGSPAPIVFVLTSIVWREAWKYGDRAYRYCLHDMGHAWQALALAAQAIGCDSLAVGHFPDDEVSQFCHLHQDEWPMLIVELRGRSIPVREPHACDTVWYGGHANQISRERTACTRIDGIHGATKPQRPVPRHLRRRAGSLLALARSGCLLQLHRGAPLARLPECGVRHSTSGVECNRCR